MLDFKTGFILLDGAMGTALQGMGLPAVETPELYNLTHPDAVTKVHARYADAGSNLIYTNTFGANRYKLGPTGHSVEEVVAAAIKCARSAMGGNGFVALDIGPLGKLLEPLGTLPFEEAYDAFREEVLAGKDADCIVIETMADLTEAKAALLAAKENSPLPVLVSMSFEADGRTYTGCRASSMARTLTALGADAVGLNCSLGPLEAEKVVREIAANTDKPVLCKPNAGLPDPMTGEFSLPPEAFAEGMRACARAGATLLGGCCGTDERYLKALSAVVSGFETDRPPVERRPFACSAVKALYLDSVLVVGERINPTGKKRLQQALLNKDYGYAASLAAEQAEAGAALLDVNAGYPGVDEKEALPALVKAVQAVTDCPLVLDSSNPEALEAALRVYTGVPVVNSFNGRKGSKEKVLPLVKKYGGCVVGLCLDDNGIPSTASGREQVAERLLDAVLEAGLPRESLIVDCLTLTAAAEQKGAGETLEAVRYVTDTLGLSTCLGVSNISFGLPEREAVTGAFLLAALRAGLKLPIVNPNSRNLMALVRASRVISGEDAGAKEYIACYAGAAPTQAAAAESVSLGRAVAKGLREAAESAASSLVKVTDDPLSLVETELMPALEEVGREYEAGRLYLPQLLSSAQAAVAALGVIRAAVPEGTGDKGKVVLATVKGDVHDIGKNIVKTVLESYGYTVIDLGKDVPPETVLQAVRENNVKLCGLSALMTTTLPAMAETAALLKTMPDPPVIMAGGAVVTETYAKSIGALYSKDAGGAADIAAEVLHA